MDPSSTASAGPSRVTRQGTEADRLAATQRKNASGALGASRHTTGSRRTDRDDNVVPDSRSQPTQTSSSSKNGPSRRDPKHTHNDGERRRTDKNEFDRGPSSGAKQLFDPSIPMPVAPRRMEPPSSPVPSAKDNDRRRDPPTPRRRLFDPDAPPPPPPPAPPARGRRQPEQDRGDRGTRHLLFDPDAPGPSSSSSKPSSHKLFDPAVHDPMSFGTRPQPSSSSSSRPSLLMKGQVPQTPEEQADRERERRKRREGSEKGSHHTSRRKDSDTRSKGSRSSEGSESFKNRDRRPGEGDSGAKAYLRAAYHEIRALEQSLTEMHRKMASDPEAGIGALVVDRRTDPRHVHRQQQQQQQHPASDDTLAWTELVQMHKELADRHYNFLKLALDPKGPPGLRPLPVKYNIPVRLWQIGFHQILERLRFAWMSHNPNALDLLTDFIYDAYQFYTELFEDQTLMTFRTAWIEALGDLARYRMAVASSIVPDAPTHKQSVDARIDDDEPFSSGASIGQEVADNWEPEDKETWRTTARDWYAMGITEKPGEGRLHHHLALLCRDVRGQEGRALYHFCKGLTASHPFETSRESVLPLFDSALQFQRSTPEATAMDLFVRLHGMLFTKIQLDDFSSVMSRFMERLEEDASLDGVSRKACVTQVDWLLMGTANLAAVLQYGSAFGLIRKALAQEGAARRRGQVTDGVDDGDDGGDDGGGVVEDDEPVPPLASDAEPPYSFILALDLAFAVLDFALVHPWRQQGIHQVLNPYITIFLTFLATIFRQPAAGAPLLTHVPWRRLAEFVNHLGLDVREESRLIGPAPLPEDWAMRGAEWVGRRVYERGFWKAKPNARGSSGGPALPRVGERFQSEMDVLLANFDSALDISEGVVDEVDGADLTDGPVAVNDRRRRRVAWAAGVLAAHVDGFEVHDGTVSVCGSLAAAIDEAAAVKAAEKAEQEWREATRRKARMPLETEEDIGAADSESEDDDPELAVLRERRRHLREVLKVPAETTPGRGSPRPAGRRRNNMARGAHNVVPGYTILIFDTNVLLSALSHFAKVVEGGQWSVIVPLPVITELDGLSKNPPPLGTEAQTAVAYLEARIRTHALCLKIQTTRGNYLTDLLIRAEHLDFAAGAGAGPISSGDDAAAPRTRGTMDDMILNVAAFQSEHFVDRSALLGMPPPPPVSDGQGLGGGATKVLLVTFDRNLRLKARSRGIDAADEKEMAAILAKG